MQTTLNAIIQHTFSNCPERDALGWKVEGEYRFITFAQLAERVCRFALGLHNLGVGKGDRVGLLSENRWEWAVADLALLSLGAINVPMFPSLPPPQVQYILKDSGACAVIVSTGEQFLKIAAIRDSLADLKHVIVCDPQHEETTHSVPMTFDAIMDMGASVEATHAETFEAAWRSIQPGDLASIIYTSGTTGEPKGVMLSHANFASNASAAAKVLHFTGEDRFLSFLPLSHVFERTAGHYLPLSVGAAIAYAESLFTVAKNLCEVKPTIMLGVPRLYENIQERILESGNKLPPTRKRIFLWAMDIARKVGKLRGQGKTLPLLLEAQHRAADVLVYQQIRESLGGRLRAFVAGGAALAPSIGEFFCGLGVTILQGYGLTESSPVITVNSPDQPRFDTVGLPISDVEIRIAPDGEILCRGPNVMCGYYKKPEETREAIDPDGWLHTGDIGAIEPDGHLKITDRKKNILVLANGKNVAPQPIENHLLQSPYINQIVLLGDGKKAVTALIVPAFDAVREHLSRMGVTATTNAAVVEVRETRQLIKAEIDRLSEPLADFERIKRFTLLPQEFSLATGELTPTLKIKRKVILEKYRKQIEAMAE